MFFHCCKVPLNIFQHQYHTMIQTSCPVLSFHLCSLKAPVVKQHSNRAHSASMKRFQFDFEEKNYQDAENTLFGEITSFWEKYFSTTDGSLLFFIHCKSSRDCLNSGLCDQNTASSLLLQWVFKYNITLSLLLEREMIKPINTRRAKKQ